MATIRRSDVDSLEQKLKVFAKELPDQERNVLGWLLTRARAASAKEGLEDEALESVAGGQSQDLASVLGFDAQAATTTVSWARSF